MNRIPVFYDPRQSVNERLPSPSAAKPRHVVDSWLARRMPVEVRTYEPVDERTLSLVHAPTYVKNILSLQRPNGFGSTSRAVAESLKWTSGSFLAAALHAWSTRRVACSPTSGFHHACFAVGGGFCTFNGLMVAAHRLLAEGARCVGVLDCDEHYGNGTEDIIENVKLLRGRVRHFTRGSPGYGDDARAFLASLEPLLTEWKARGVDIVLYQAGADPHIDDPLGGFLTSKQLAQRDRIVFSACRRLGLPIAWNLAGGYQEKRDAGWPECIRPVLDIHDATMRECVRAFVTSSATAGNDRGVASESANEHGGLSELRTESQSVAAAGNEDQQ